jgi:hypothetical protein
VNADEHSEIAASVAAHAELGPQYDAAVAEGLVERIGAEIDKRIDARLRNPGHPAQAAAPSPPPTPMPSHPMPGRTVPPLMPYPMQQQMPAAPAQQPILQQPPQVPAHRGAGATIAGTILALGSMGLGVGATAVVASHDASSFAKTVMILLIWVAIVIVNGLHARFYWRPDGPPPRR